MSTEDVYAHAVLVRVSMALVAVLVLAWLAVLLRDYEVGRDGLVERDPEQVESARLLDPNRDLDLTLASVYLLNGESRRAAAEAERLVAAEPDNAVAWSLLRAATREDEPRRSAQAATELRKLNPLGPG
jgi:predicted Zn-dependent protease